MLKRILRRWRWILAGLAVLGMGSVLTGWLLFQHIPGWYRPARAPTDPAELQRIRDDLTGTFDAVGQRLNKAQGAFTFRFTQDQINTWLAAREAIDPMTRNWLPPELSDPMVAIDRDGVRLAAIYTHGKLRTIVSAKLAIDADGQGVKVRLEDISGGSLSIPDVAIRKTLEAMDGRFSAELQKAGVSVSGRQTAKISDLLDGLTLPNAGKWPVSGHRFRLIGVEFEHGAVVLKVERLRNQTLIR